MSIDQRPATKADLEEVHRRINALGDRLEHVIARECGRMRKLVGMLGEGLTNDMEEDKRDIVASLDRVEDVLRQTASANVGADQRHDGANMS